MVDVIKVVEGLDLVIETAVGVVHPDDVARARDAAGRARDRRGYLGGTLVVGIIGGTGSGKSSLLNALAGRPVASVSAVRPHTARPLAWAPVDAEPGLDVLLDGLGIDERVSQSGFPGLCLLDATDVDSVELGHRRQVEALLPRIDAVIWVLDPDKYADPLLHEEFIRPLADSADQFLFVLNQTDRLDKADRVSVADDLQRRLVADGIAETRRAARDLASGAGLLGGTPLGFEERWKVVLGEVTTRLALAEDGDTTFEEVFMTLRDLVGDVAARSGGPFSQRIRSRFPSGEIERVLREVVDEVGRSVPRGEAGVIVPERRADAAGLLSDLLQQELAAPLREILWERSSLSASVAGLAVEAAQAEARLRA